MTATQSLSSTSIITTTTSTGSSSLTLTSLPSNGRTVNALPTFTAGEGDGSAIVLSAFVVLLSQSNFSAGDAAIAMSTSPCYVDALEADVATAIIRGSVAAAVEAPGIPFSVAALTVASGPSELSAVQPPDAYVMMNRPSVGIVSGISSTIVNASSTSCTATYSPATSARQLQSTTTVPPKPALLHSDGPALAGGTLIIGLNVTFTCNDNLTRCCEAARDAARDLQAVVADHATGAVLFPGFAAAAAAIDRDVWSTVGTTNVSLLKAVTFLAFGAATLTCLDASIAPPVRSNALTESELVGLVVALLVGVGLCACFGFVVLRRHRRKQTIVGVSSAHADSVATTVVLPPWPPLVAAVPSSHSVSSHITSPHAHAAVSVQTPADTASSTAAFVVGAVARLAGPPLPREASTRRMRRDTAVDTSDTGDDSPTVHDARSAYAPGPSLSIITIGRALAASASRRGSFGVSDGELDQPGRRSLPRTGIPGDLDLSFGDTGWGNVMDQVPSGCTSPRSVAIMQSRSPQRSNPFAVAAADRRIAQAAALATASSPPRTPASPPGQKRIDRRGPRWTDVPIGELY